MAEFPNYNIPMDIQPYEPCEYCDKRNWGIATVNVAKRVDLFTGEICKNYRGSSDCKECGMQTYWHISPDKPYDPVL